MSANKLINLVFCILSLFCLYIALKNGDIQAMATFNVIAFVTASLLFPLEIIYGRCFLICL